VRTIRTVLSLLSVLLLITGTVFAQEAPTYTVKPGDTLFSIAQAHDLSVDELRRLNDLEDGVIRAGMVLIVGEVPERPVAGWNRADPDSTTTDSLAATDTPAGPEPGSVLMLEGGLARVTLGPGETLYSLARRFSLHPDSLLAVNPGLPAVLRRGDAITVPADRTTRQVTVRTGDTLFSLARRYDVGVAAIRTANRLSGDNIRVGQTLDIPSSRVAFDGSGDAALPVFETVPAYVYPDSYHGRMMAGGRPYDRDAYVLSHPDLPLDTIVLVEVADSERSVFAVVADRGPGVQPRSIELSRELARAIGLEEEGMRVAIRRVH